MVSFVDALTPLVFGLLLIVSAQTFEEVARSHGLRTREGQTAEDRVWSPRVAALYAAAKLVYVLAGKTV
jgi:hypothetical protein